MRDRRRAPWAWLTTVIVVASLAPAASAQYFGSNKVQYKSFAFEVLKTEHFDIYFYPSERPGVDVAARMAERWYVRLSRLFDHTLRGRQPLVLYASHPDFEQTNVIGGDIGEGTGGVTEPVRRRIVLPLGGPLADTDHVLGHELVHAFQYDLTSRSNQGEPGAGLARLPLWFVEGMAEYLSLGPVDPQTAMWLRDTTWQDKLPAVKQLDNPKYFPYRWGHAFWAYVGGRWGDHVVLKLLLTAAANGDAEGAIQHVLGMKHTELSAAWHRAIKAAYTPVLASTTPAAHVGRVLIDERGDMNVGPAISPDGRWIAFLSERSLVSMDLFVADAATGKIVRKLTSTASNPHYSSLQFIYSAGAWDASSRRFAVAVVTSGTPALAIFDGMTGTREREIAIADVDEVFNPTWSPDGRALCFTGMSAGFTDLFVYDLTTSSLRRLTDDPYADLQPAWSPDGSRIAFVTDRFTTDLATLAIGEYRLATIDAASAAIARVPSLERGKHINPQWTGNGRSLVFLSDRDGIANLYEAELSTGWIRQLTNITTGVTGITPSSPALSVASDSGTAALSIYRGGKYAIHTLDIRTAPAVAATPGSTGELPPLDRQPSDVARLLADATLGLPPARVYSVERYKATLAPEAVVQPSIAVGVDRFGAALGGGVGLMFADMLGTHSLTTAFQFNTSISGNTSVKDVAAQALYLNQQRRWNWGVVGGQVPYTSGLVQSGVARYNGQLAQIDRVVLYRQIERSAAGIAAYPFNRARRVEITTGVTRMAFEGVTRTDVYSLTTGARLFSGASTVSLADPLMLTTAAAAFVSDTSVTGATSPVTGERYRLEAAPTFGTIGYTGLLADYRRYVMPVPFYTIATRALSYGRYGSGATDVRLSPLYLGYMTLVRGYDVNSFDAGECVPDAVSSCPVFDRLVGSRMLVGNLEFRFPLLRPFGVSRRMYGPVPVEVGLFTDGGVAWHEGQRPSLFGGTRKGVASAGATFRVNLMGFAVAQIDAVRPFQRPRAGWVFQFNLIPGF